MKRNVILALAAITLLAGCAQKKKTAETTEQKTVLVKTAAAESRTIAQNEEFTANIEAYKENDITPAVSGVRINRILVDVGDHVRRGQLLVEMDPTQYNQQLVNLKNAEDTYNRTKQVYDVGGVSKQNYDQASNALTQQREVTANLRKNVKLLSPIDGIVTARNSEAGNLFSNQPILHVMQINKLKVTVSISEQYYTKVKIGTAVKVMADVFPDQTFEGKVTLIHPSVDPATRTFTVEVTIPNAKEQLRPGMFSRTIFNMGDKTGILIPDVCIQRQSGTNERYVYVIKDGKAERRVVEVGRQVDDKVDILSGVSDGETVATTSLSKLSTGTPVKVENK